jgi:hypothetical protein
MPLVAKKKDDSGVLQGYTQNWLNGNTLPEASAQKIFRASDRILCAGREQ